MRQELVVLLTPHIVRCRAEANRMSAIESRRMDWAVGNVLRTHGTSGMEWLTEEIHDLYGTHGPRAYPPGQVGPFGPNLMDPSKAPATPLPPPRVLPAPPPQPTAPQPMPVSAPQTLPAPVQNYPAAAVPATGYQPTTDQGPIIHQMKVGPPQGGQ